MGNWTAMLGNHAWQAAATAVVVCALLRVGQHWPSRLREGIAAIGLLKFLVPPSAGLAIGLWNILGAGDAINARSLGPSNGEPGLTASLLAWLPAIHVIGGAIVAALAAVSSQRRRRLCRGAIADADLTARAEAAASRVGLTRRVRVMMSADADTPTASGVIRPLVLIPAALVRELTPAKLDAVLIHELSHHRRGHLMWRWAAMWLCAFWWWNPLIWIIAAESRRAQEERCDDDVVRLGIPAAAYCDALVSAARTRVGSAAVAASMADAGPELRSRLTRLLRRETVATNEPRIVTLAVLLVLAALLLPGTTARRSAYWASGPRNDVPRLVANEVREAMGPGVPGRVRNHVAVSIERRIRSRMTR